MKEVTVQEVKDKMDNGESPILIDVREDFEYELSHITENHIRLGTLADKVSELEEWKDKEVIMVCRSGARSANATQFLEAQGFSNVSNMKGGMKAWAQHIEPGIQVA